MLALDSVLFFTSDLLIGFGFLMVLWSRLHLVMDRPRILYALLGLIFIVAVVLKLFIALATIGSPPNRYRPRWGNGVWQVMYRLEVLIPGLEIILAGLYAYLFLTRFRNGRSDKTFRRSFWLLIIGELFVITGDAAIISVWLSGLVLLKWAIGTFVYALKLGVEMLILNSLTMMSQQQGSDLRHITSLNPDEEAAAMPQEPVVIVDMHDGMSRLPENEKQASDEAEQQVSALALMLSPSAAKGKQKASPSATSLERTTSLDVWERRYLGR